MGTTPSTNMPPSTLNADGTLKPATPTQVLDYVATYYILTMDFVGLKKLYSPKYCNKLVVLTADVVERYFTGMDIHYLQQRVKNGEEVNVTASDKVLFFDRDDVGKFDVQNSFKKKNMCIAISKFYVKIAHLFAAIATTINPVYTFRDSSGVLRHENLFSKHSIPPNTPRTIEKLNICNVRIQALKRMRPNSCSLKRALGSELSSEPRAATAHSSKGPAEQPANRAAEAEVVPAGGGERATSDTVAGQPGIPQLRALYNDADYNYETGQFDGMTPETRRQFESDLAAFYQTFTGKALPAGDSIRDFSDIPLRDYNRDCPFSAVAAKDAAEAVGAPVLMNEYAAHLAQMVARTERGQQALLGLLDSVFVYTVDPQSKKNVVRVAPTLTEASLQKLVLEARRIIVSLYLRCEIDYTKGLQLYEAVVLQKTLAAAKSQIRVLEREQEKLVERGNAPIPEPVPAPATAPIPVPAPAAAPVPVPAPAAAPA